jgi:maltodextrin utilization protein YvdJ
MNAERLSSLAKLFGTWLERLLAAGIVAGIIAYGVASTGDLVEMNWHDSATFYELIYRVLLMVIGIELVRTLLTHSLEAILELLAFVVARKTFKADVEAFDIFLCALAFVALLAARHFFLREGQGILFKSERLK